MHVDPVRTHVISAIINIDQQLDENVSLRILLISFLYYLKLAYQLPWFWIIQYFLIDFLVFYFSNATYIIYAFVFYFDYENYFSIVLLI